MKTILLALILATACGKHTSPPAEDLGDADGDSIRNNEDHGKFVSDLPDFGLVQGRMKIHLKPEILEIKFSSKSTKENNFFDLLTQGHLLSKERIRQAGWSNLILDTTKMPKLNAFEYDIDLRFEIERSQPAFLVYEDGSGQTILQKWESVMRVTLSSERLEKIITGYANLRLLRNSPHPQFDAIKSDELLRAKTYEVLINRGSTSKVLNVSNEMSFYDFLKHQKIDKATSVEKLDLFFIENSDYKSWWYQKLNARTYVLVKASIDQLKENYFAGFTKVSNKVVRKNGLEGVSAVAHTEPGAQLYFKVRWSRTLNRFKKEKKMEVFRSNQRSHNIERLNHCTVISRKILKPVKASADISFFTQNFFVLVDGRIKTFEELGATIEPNQDEAGQFLNIGMKSTGHIIEFGLLRAAKATYVNTGAIDQKCNHAEGIRKLPQARTNTEHLFTVKVDSYVEKME